MVAMRYVDILEHGRQLRLNAGACAPMNGKGWTPGSVSAAFAGSAALCSSKIGEVPSTV
jgi:hypothetical protein